VTTLVNKRLARPREGDVFIARPSIFGSPFKVGDDGTHDEVLVKYQAYFLDRLVKDEAFRVTVDALKGKRLACWCRPPEGFKGRVLCHGQFLVAFLDNILPTEVP